MQAKYNIGAAVELLGPPNMKGLTATIYSVDLSGSVTSDQPYYRLKLDVPYVNPLFNFTPLIDIGRSEAEIKLI